MIGLKLILEGDGAWTDLSVEDVIHIAGESPPLQVAVLDGGLVSGRPSVAIRADLPDGRTVVVETSARLFVTAAQAIHARYPDLLKDPDSGK